MLDHRLAYPNLRTQPCNAMQCNDQGFFKICGVPRPNPCRIMRGELWAARDWSFVVNFEDFFSTSDRPRGPNQASSAVSHPTPARPGKLSRFFFRIYQARSLGRESDEGRPGGGAKISENPTFLRIFSE